MRDYLLFLDTEASGLPRKWNLPYTNSANWPSAVQLAWIIYTKDGILIKTENHYINDEDIVIKPSAIKIHGITREYLNEHGETRESVLQLFAEDLKKYQPLILGHFMEFDYHILSADFFRVGKYNPMPDFPTFCTMLASSFYVQEPTVNHLRLGELYARLFNAKLMNQHNALADANATADCFFELKKRGDITDATIDSQQLKAKEERVSTGFPWLIFSIIVLLFALLIFFWYESTR